MTRKEYLASQRKEIKMEIDCGMKKIEYDIKSLEKSIFLLNSFIKLKPQS